MRAEVAATRIPETGENRAYSNSPRTKIFDVTATSTPPPTTKPRSQDAFFCWLEGKSKATQVGLLTGSQGPDGVGGFCWPETSVVTAISARPTARPAKP